MVQRCRAVRRRALALRGALLLALLAGWVGQVGASAQRLPGTGASTQTRGVTTSQAPDAWPQYAPYTIEGLRSRGYGGGKIEIVRVMEETRSFTRYLFAYPSDGLRITGMLTGPGAKGLSRS